MIFIALGLLVGAGCTAASSTSNVAATPPDYGRCRDGEEDRERWSANCLCCHDGEFGVAGSIAHDAGVVKVKIRDRDGKIAEMFPNPYDNFFQHRPLTPPLSATVVLEDGSERTMRDPAPHGSCNGCHGESIPLVGSGRPRP